MPIPRFNNRFHPAEGELFAYAEGLHDRSRVVDSRLAAHVVTCVTCRDEIGRMRQTFDVANPDAGIQTSHEFQATLVLAARQIRARRSRRVRLLRAARRSGAVAAAAAVLIAAAMTGREFSADTTKPVPAKPRSIVEAAPEVSLAVASAPGASDGERLLESAVEAPYWTPRSSIERARIRAIEALDRSIEDAIVAREKNLYAGQAVRTIQQNRARKWSTLRALYAEREL